MFKAALRTVFAHKLRLALTALAIVLGVAFVVGTLIFTDTISKTFDNLFEDTLSGTDVIVQTESDFDPGFSGPPPFDEGMVAVVAEVPGVEAAEGGVQGYAQLIDKDGEAIAPIGPPTIGGSAGEDERFDGNIVLREGRRPTAPGEIIVDARTVKDAGFQLGDQITVLLVGGNEVFELVGVVGFGESDNLAGATFTGFETVEAQRVLDLDGQFTTISVIAAEGETPSALADRIQLALPEGMEAVTTEAEVEEATDAIGEQLGFIRTVLLVFAGIAVFVGLFIIFNTFRIIVAQRMREMALLRAVGATGRQVMTMVFVESLIVAIIASAIGILAGLFIAQVITGLFDAIGFSLPSTGPELKVGTIIWGFVVGISATLVSVAMPAIRASRVPPVAALQDVEIQPMLSLKQWGLIGGGILALGLILVLNGLFGDVLDFGPLNELTAVMAGAVVMFLGVAILSVLFIKPLARFLGAPIAALGNISGKLARENTIRKPRRTAATTSALMIGLALVGFFFILGESIRSSVSVAIEEGLRADFVVSVDGFAGGFSPLLGEEIAANDEIAAVTNLRIGFWDNDGSDDILIGLDSDTVDQTIFLDVQQGSLQDLIAGGVFVLDDTAKENDWVLGDRIPMGFSATGLQEVEIVGTYAEANVVQSNYVSGLQFHEDNYVSQLDFVLAIAAADGVSLEAARAAVEESTAAYPNVTVRDQAEYRQNQEDQIDQLLVLFQGLLFLAVIISFLGIVNTLVLSILERTREIGLLRAVGMSRWQVRRMILWESITVSIIGAIFGIVVGLFFGVVVVAALGSQGITELTIPFGSILGLVVLAIIVGVLAALLPARKAANLNILEAISYE